VPNSIQDTGDAVKFLSLMFIFWRRDSRWAEIDDNMFKHSYKIYEVMSKKTRA
jgi:hypothetical protein